MRYFILLASAFLFGCANVGSLQAECENTTSTFNQMVSCLDGRIKQDGRLARSQEVKLYMLRAQQLSQQVESKQIGELDAKVELQRLFVQLKAREDDDADEIINRSMPNRTMRTNCSTYGGVTNCTTR